MRTASILLLSLAWTPIADAGSLVLVGHISQVTEDERFYLFTDVTGLDIGSQVLVTARWPSSDYHRFDTNDRTGRIGDTLMSTAEAEQGYRPDLHYQSIAKVWADKERHSVQIDTMFIGHGFHGMFFLGARDESQTALDSPHAELSDFLPLSPDDWVETRGRGPDSPIRKWYECGCHGGLGTVYITTNEREGMATFDGETTLRPTGKRYLYGDHLGDFEIILDRIYYNEFGSEIVAIPEPSALTLLAVSVALLAVRLFSKS